MFGGQLGGRRSATLALLSAVTFSFYFVFQRQKDGSLLNTSSRTG
jgi:hypothetical protein